MTWNRPPSCAMSSPITNTPGSRSISSCSASFSASDIVSSRCVAALTTSLPGVSQSAGAYTSSSAASGSGRGEASANSTASSTSRRACSSICSSRAGSTPCSSARWREKRRIGSRARQASSSSDGPEVGLGRRGVGRDAVALRLDQRRALAGAGARDRLGRDRRARRARRCRRRRRPGSRSRPRGRRCWRSASTPRPGSRSPTRCSRRRRRPARRGRRRGCRPRAGSPGSRRRRRRSRATTPSRPWRRSPWAAPTAIADEPATIASAPSMPLSIAVMCMLPPRPRQ